MSSAERTSAPATLTRSSVCRLSSNLDVGRQVQALVGALACLHRRELLHSARQPSAPPFPHCDVDSFRRRDPPDLIDGSRPSPAAPPRASRPYLFASVPRLVGNPEVHQAPFRPDAPNPAISFSTIAIFSHGCRLEVIRRPETRVTRAQDRDIDIDRAIERGSRRQIVPHVSSQ